MELHVLNFESFINLFEEFVNDDAVYKDLYINGNNLKSRILTNSSSTNVDYNTVVYDKFPSGMTSKKTKKELGKLINSNKFKDMIVDCINNDKSVLDIDKNLLSKFNDYIVKILQYKPIII